MRYCTSNPVIWLPPLKAGACQRTRISPEPSPLAAPEATELMVAASGTVAGVAERVVLHGPVPLMLVAATSTS